MFRHYPLPIAISVCICLYGLTYAIAFAKQPAATDEQSSVNTMLCIVSSDVNGAEKTFRIAFDVRNPSPKATKNLTLTAKFNPEHANRIKWLQRPTIENNRECIWHLDVLPADMMISIHGEIVVSRPLEIEFHLEDFERTYPSSFVELGTWGTAWKSSDAPSDVQYFAPSEADRSSEKNTEDLPSN